MLVVSAVSLLTCSGLACTDGTSVAPPPSLTSDPVAVPASVGVESTDIIVDATPSMRGFAKGAQYRTLVAQTFANASPNGAPARYFRLTTAVPGGIQPVAAKTQVAKASFYARGDTKLETAIDSMQSRRLTVLVTDLFQSNADVNAVGQRLIERVLAKGKAVGMIGVRLPFDGRIYDLGFENRSFAYRGTRPVYALVLGETDAVATYFENVRRYVQAKGFRFLILSEHVVSSSASFGPLEETDNAKSRSIPFATNVPADRLTYAEIGDNNRAAYLTRSVRMHLYPDVPPVRVEDIRVDVREAWAYEPDTGEYAKSNSTARAVSGRVTSSGVGPKLRLSMDPKSLSRGHHVFNMNLSVSQLSTPRWIEDWDLPPREFDADSPDGSRTANLKPFVLNLSSNLTSETSPVVGTFQLLLYKGRK